MKRSVGALLVAIASSAVFWATAYPTITWWDSSNYSTAAYTLGIPSPPGSLLLTLIGWPVSHLPFGHSPAWLLNLFAGLLMGIATALLFVVVLQLRDAAAATAPQRTSPDSIGSRSPTQPTAVVIGAALGALSFAFSATTWEYATKFTPYVLTIVFTGAILWTMVRWWIEADAPNAWRWLALLSLLFGLDFSVHRTNAMLMPSVIVWVMIRNPAAFRQWRVYASTTAAMAGALSVQLLVIPIAIFTKSSVRFNSPDTLGRFWDFVSLSQYGGGFLVQFFPRKSNLWRFQTMDLLSTLRDNVANTGGHVGMLGLLPLVAAIAGVIAVWMRNRRLGLAIAACIFVHAATTVMYFNIPDNFFRTFDRHYLPVFCTIGVVIAYGLSECAQYLAGNQRWSPPVRIAIATGIVAVLPAVQIIDNWSSHDASGRVFARDFAFNMLNSQPRDAILFTVGDNDTYPLMYLQAAEHVRPDVSVVNISVLNMPMYPEYLRRLDPTFPIRLSTDDRAAIIAAPWADSLVTLPVVGTARDLGVENGATMLSALSLKIQKYPGLEHVLEADVSMLDILRTNAWRRPITFAMTAGSSPVAWLEQYLRPSGMFSRLVPELHPAPDAQTALLTMIDQGVFTGYANEDVTVDEIANRIAFLYYDALGAIVRAPTSDVTLEQCTAAVRKLEVLIPQARLKRSEYFSLPSLNCGQSPNR